MERIHTYTPHHPATYIDVCTYVGVRTKEDDFIHRIICQCEAFRFLKLSSGVSYIYIERDRDRDTHREREKET